MPKVSVVIPVYGVEKYIERCARSLFEQTLDDIEYIFVDDCTPDRSIEILESIIEEYRLRFAEEKKVVRIVRMPTNSGQAAVRRHGIQLATGDYIIHCDSDDWVDVDMYRAMYEKAVEDNSDIVVCDYLETDGQDYNLKKIGCHDTNPNGFLRKCLLLIDSWAVWNKMCARTIYTGMQYPKAAMGEDMVITTQLLLRCNSISYLPLPYYNYFMNFNSITHTHNEAGYLKKYNQIKINTDYLIEILLNDGSIKQKKAMITCLKFNVNTMLYPLIGDKKYFHLWKSTYKGYACDLLFTVGVPISYKIKYLLTLIHLYPRKNN